MQMGAVEMARIHFRLNLIMCSRFWHMEILMSMLFSINIYMWFSVILNKFRQTTRLDKNRRNQINIYNDLKSNEHDTKFYFAFYL